MTILLCIDQPAGATDVAGNVSGVWDVAGNPYVATDHLTVPARSLLETGAGVEVRFDCPHRLRVAVGSVRRGSTTIRFTLAEAADVCLEIYDLAGCRMGVAAEGRFPAGSTRSNSPGRGWPPESISTVWKPG